MNPYPVQSSVRPPLRRFILPPAPGYPRGYLWGICSGLAVHLQLPVALIRAAFLLFPFLGGVPLFVYLALWVVVARGNPLLEMEAAATATGGGAMARSLGDNYARSLRAQATAITPRENRYRLLLTGIVLLIVALILTLWWQSYLDISRHTLTAVSGVSSLLLIGQAALDRVWDSPLGQWNTGSQIRISIQLGAGLLLLFAAGFLFLSNYIPLITLLMAMVVSAATAAIIAVVAIPVGLRMIRAASEFHGQQIRETARADMAAHLHDSVLQTLTLIRQQAPNAALVDDLARRQERELRTWLYADHCPDSTGSLAEQCRQRISELEDRYHQEIELVVVGDAPAGQEEIPGNNADSYLAIICEALANAIRHGKPPVKVYCELTANRYCAYIRDHGDGFRTEDIPADRHGVRDCLLGRAHRGGGVVQLRRRDPGMEIEVQLPAQNPHVKELV